MSSVGYSFANRLVYYVFTVFMTQSAVVAAQAWPTDIDELTVPIDNRKINSIIEKQSVWTSDWTVFFIVYYLIQCMFRLLHLNISEIFICNYFIADERRTVSLIFDLWQSLRWPYLILISLLDFTNSSFIWKLILTYAINLHCTTIYEFFNYLNTIYK